MGDRVRLNLFLQVERDTGAGPCITFPKVSARKPQAAIWLMSGAPLETKRLFSGAIAPARYFLTAAPSGCCLMAPYSGMPSLLLVNDTAGRGSRWALIRPLSEGKAALPGLLHKDSVIEAMPEFKSTQEPSCTASGSRDDRQILT